MLYFPWSVSCNSAADRSHLTLCLRVTGCAPKIVGCRFPKNVTKPLFRGNGKGFNTPLVMMHYSRSLEKYELKSRTWKTASGEQAKSDRYQIGGFSDRQLGKLVFNMNMHISLIQDVLLS